MEPWTNIVNGRSVYALPYTKNLAKKINSYLQCICWVWDWWWLVVAVMFDRLELSLTPVISFESWVFKLIKRQSQWNLLCKSYISLRFLIEWYYMNAHQKKFMFHLENVKFCSWLLALNCEIIHTTAVLYAINDAFKSNISLLDTCCNSWNLQ